MERISALIYEETRSLLKLFLANLVKSAGTYTEHGRRKTISYPRVIRGRLLCFSRLPAWLAAWPLV